jgi:hypothetical protein
MVIMNLKQLGTSKTFGNDRIIVDVDTYNVDNTVLFSCSKGQGL